MKSILVGASVLLLDGGVAQAASLHQAGTTEGHKMSQAAVEIKLSGQRRGRPPQVKLEVDVVLRNADAQRRWFILPKDLPNPLGRGGVDVVEAHAYGGKSKVVVGRFLGSGGFQAVLVPAGGEVKLHRLPLSYWGDVPQGAIPVEVVIASDIQLGGEPAQSWFAADPTAPQHAEAGAEGSELAGSHKSPDGKERPVVIAEVRRVTAEMSVH